MVGRRSAERYLGRNAGTLAVGNFENDRVLQASRTGEAEAPANTRQSPHLKGRTPC
jgi:hypothetical protein